MYKVVCRTEDGRLISCIKHCPELVLEYSTERSTKAYPGTLILCFETLEDAKGFIQRGWNNKWATKGCEIWLIKWWGKKGEVRLSNFDHPLERILMNWEVKLMISQPPEGTVAVPTIKLLKQVYVQKGERYYEP